MKPSHVTGGFKRSGIFPLSKHKVLCHLEPSTLLIEGVDKPMLPSVICSKCGEKSSANPFVQAHLKPHLTGLLQIKQCPKCFSKSTQGERHLDDNMEVETENDVEEDDLEGENNVYYIHECQILSLF